MKGHKVMEKELKLISIIEEKLLELSLVGYIPAEVYEHIEQACLAIMQARNQLQMSLEEQETTLSAK
jgi:hypothetical protein